tara:strand:+ start:864 stop:1202 length:339 start_codon:yes stop_codon:yes gene_type:complete
MDDTFKPVNVGKQFPKEGKGIKRKYVTEGTISLLMANLGDVFLIHEVKDIGNNTNEVTRIGNTMRNSGRLAAIAFHTDNPNYKMRYAVRQSSKEGGYARLYAKIEERKDDNA